MKVAINSIIVGKDRIRKDMGDLAELMESIVKHGLLQPIGIIKEEEHIYRLNYGERRLRACKELGWREISVTLRPEEDNLGAEEDENECRKDLTSQERIAHKKRIDGTIKREQGKRNDLTSVAIDTEVTPGKDGKNAKNEKEDPKEVEAKKLGFANYTEMHRTEKMLANCHQDIIDEFESKHLSLIDCLSICELPKAEQARILKRKVTEGLGTLKQAWLMMQKEESPAPDQADPVFDKFGVLVPDGLLYLIEECKQWEAVREEIKAARSSLNKLDKTIMMSRYHGTGQLQPNLKQVETFLAQNQFSFVCPACEGVKTNPPCDCCEGKLWFAVCDEDKVDRKRFGKKKAS